VAFVEERSMKRNVLDFRAVDESMCILRIKTKLHNLHLISTCFHRGEGGNRKGNLLSEYGRIIRHMSL
jgi:hypothetical protein